MMIFMYTFCILSHTDILLVSLWILHYTWIIGQDIIISYMQLYSYSVYTRSLTGIAYITAHVVTLAASVWFLLCLNLKGREMCIQAYRRLSIVSSRNEPRA